MHLEAVAAQMVPFVAAHHFVLIVVAPVEIIALYDAALMVGLDVSDEIFPRRKILMAVLVRWSVLVVEVRRQEQEAGAAAAAAVVVGAVVAAAAVAKQRSHWRGGLDR